MVEARFCRHDDRCWARHPKMVVYKFGVGSENSGVVMTIIQPYKKVKRDRRINKA